MKERMKKDSRWVSVDVCRTGRSVAEELRGEAVVIVVTSTTVRVALGESQRSGSIR
jgi:hypothetical protein